MHKTRMGRKDGPYLPHVGKLWSRTVLTNPAPPLLPPRRLDMSSSLKVLADIFIEADSKGFRLSGQVSSSRHKVSSVTLPQPQVPPTRSNALHAAVCTRP
jgi:hypothetical protein